MKYTEKKNKARELAIYWQNNLSCHNRPVNKSWGYYIKWTLLFEHIGRKYGLIREFKENGIL